MMKSFRSSGSISSISSISSIGLIGNIVLALGLLAACTAPPPRVKVLPPANVPAKIDQTKPPVKIDTEGLDELQEAAKEAAGEAAKPGEESEGGLSEAANEAAERKGREELYRLMRTYPGDSIPEGVRQKGYEVLQTQLAAQALQNKPEANAWQPIGPSPIRDEAMGEAVKVNSAGRATAILVNPQNPNIVYVAGAQGGVWKTTNGGDTWTPLTDGQPSLAIGTMTFDPNNAEIIYVGTGEPHGSDSYYGAGILKSSNGGTSWTQLGADTFGGLGIADIVISRNDPNTLYVAASDAPSGYTKKPLAQRPGIYKSTDGGVSWTRVVDVCDTQGLCASMSALVVSPTDPNTLYAGVDFVGVLKTTNAGANWASVLSFDNTVNVGRVEVAISPANANTLFAGIEINQDDGSSYGFLFKATDGGTKWDQISGFPNSTKPLKDSYCGGQCNYDNAIVFHPTNANIVFAGGNAKYSQSISGIDGALFKTTDGGTTWSFNNGKAANTTLHPDLHAIAFSKSNPSIMWVGTDGGVYRSTDGGGTWQDRNTGLATLQFQSVALHPTNPQIAFGGMQDNAKAKTTDGSTWLGLDVGDGGFVAIDPFDPKYWYGTRFSISGQVVQLQRNANNGSAPVEDWPEANTGINIKSDRVLFYVPFTTDPNTAGRLYLGTNRLYRTNNRADSWTAISGDMTKGTGRGISAITVMRGNANIVLLGTSDGNVQVTTNGGTSFTNITKAPLPNRFVADVAVENAQTFYVAFNGFNANTQTTPGHIFKTTDGGTTWSNVSKDGAADGLPDLPVQAMVLDGSAVYVGTDLGVYRSLNGGTSWEPFNQGMPNVAIFDLAIQKYASGAKVLAAATHGRSIWRIVLEGDITPSFKNKLFVPLVMREAKNLPQPTVTPGPSPTPIPSATTGPTPTTTPTQQPGGSTATPTSTPTQPAGNTATPMPTNTPATNPPTQTPTTPAQSGRISGVVRANGAGISGIKLRLLNCSLESNCTSVQTATSTTGGQYQFDNPPALQSGDYYRVSYYNDSDGNPNDTTKLTFWRGPSVDAFASGDVANGGTFDIKDVVLSSPLGGVSRALPTSFTWVSRSISGDSYTWQMAEFTAPSTVGAELCFDSVGTLTTSTITSSDLLDVTICDGAYNTEYAWYVYVFTTANNGYGASYYYRTVTFTSSAQVAGTPAENSQSTMARSKELRTTPPLEEAK